MKKLIAVIVFVVGFAFNTNAQEVKTVSLEQTKGEFTQKQITLSEGSYIFEISNTNVGHNVGFWHLYFALFGHTQGSDVFFIFFTDVQYRYGGRDNRGL